ncbi:MAG: hypothetical protein ACTSRK_19705 [Promethearchaeota archaeon]
MKHLVYVTINVFAKILTTTRNLATGGIGCARNFMFRKHFADTKPLQNKDVS